MAISVERVRTPRPHPRLEVYGARLLAFAAYGGLLVLAFVLFGSALGLRGGSDDVVLPPPVEPELVEVRAGDTPALLAAEQGLSVSRLLALNPELSPLGLEPGETVRVR
ncbi:MAG TPA: LysM domain-containing protein [Gaiellaceae bacterium]|nr:LysM domain-containing protein [Gaiellaceae bacterium]